MINKRIFLAGALLLGLNAETSYAISQQELLTQFKNTLKKVTDAEILCRRGVARTGTFSIRSFEGMACSNSLVAAFAEAVCPSKAKDYIGSQCQKLASAKRGTSTPEEFLQQQVNKFQEAKELFCGQVKNLHPVLGKVCNSLKIRVSFFLKSPKYKDDLQSKKRKLEGLKNAIEKVETNKQVLQSVPKMQGTIGEPPHLIPLPAQDLTALAALDVKIDSAIGKADSLMMEGDENKDTLTSQDENAYLAQLNELTKAIDALDTHLKSKGYMYDVANDSFVKIK